MYFSYIPYIKYDNKPISYPFSESDFTVVKNFFRRYQITQDVFSYAVAFQKYSIKDGERLDTLAERAYGNPFYDWIIVITNNMINPLFSVPMSESELRKHCENQYDDPYQTPHHYETIEVKAGYQIDGIDVVALKGGLIVDESFYNSSYKYWNGQVVSQIAGDIASRPVSIFEFESTENEKRREIYLLKPKYLESFIEDFRRTNLYKECSDYISNQLKKTGV
jgi:hypothetical protein